MSRALAVSAVAVVIATLSGCASDSKCDTLLKKANASESDVSKDPACDGDFCTTCGVAVKFKDDANKLNETFAGEEITYDKQVGVCGNCETDTKVKNCVALLKTSTAAACDPGFCDNCEDASPAWYTSAQGKAFDDQKGKCTCVAPVNPSKDSTCQAYLKLKKPAVVAECHTFCSTCTDTDFQAASTSAEEKTTYTTQLNTCNVPGQYCPAQAVVACKALLNVPDNKANADGVAQCATTFCDTCKSAPVNPTELETATYKAQTEVCKCDAPKSSIVV